MSAEWRQSAQSRRCRTPRRRSLHNPICRPSSRCVADRNLCPGKPPEGQLDGGEGNEGGQGFGEVLEVLGEMPIAAEPGEGASTTQRRGRTTKAFSSSCRLTISRRSGGTFPPQRQPARRCRRLQPRSGLGTGSGGVSCREPNPLRRGLESRRSGQRPASAALRCRPGRGSCGPLPLCRRRNPPGCRYRPFSADLIDWLSRTAAEGLASRPIRSRNAICSSAQIAQTPSRWNLRKIL
jgi:hypothetical protein